MNLKQYMRYRTRGGGTGGNKIVDMYKRRLGRLRQVRVKKSLILFMAAAILVTAAVLVVRYHVYNGYTVISSAENEDTQSSGYTLLGDSLLKYGDDGAYLLSQSQEIQWNQTYEMSNPAVCVQGDKAVIYDKKGTLMYIMEKTRPVGAVETKFPVLKAKITEKGAVAAILEDGERTWVNYYAPDGSVIAENQTRIDNPGYPLDLAVSPNGEVLAVSYLLVENGEISSRILYYNFGDEGQGKTDNIVAEFTYPNIVVPQIIYLNDRTSVALRDDGFSIFEGSSVPEEKVNEKIDTEIVSTFYNDKYFGIVFGAEEENVSYIMKVYDPSGREKCSEKFEGEYENISLSGDRIVMCYENQVRMYTLDGILKYEGALSKGAVKNLFQLSSKRYIVVSEDGINTVNLKW